MRLPIVSAIYRKEMLDLLRDRRTVLSMIVVPVLVMPLLMLAMAKFVAMTTKRAREESRTMYVGVHVQNPELREALRQAGIKLAERTDLRSAIEKKEISAGVEEVVAAPGQVQVSVYQDNSNPTSGAAGEQVRAVLNTLKEIHVREGLRKAGVSEDVLTPFTVQQVNVAPPKKMAGMVWGSMLGYLLLLMMFSGGIYPVIDMTAGEKERKTLEPFLATPVGRGEIVTGKILAAITSVAVTATLTLVSMTVSLKGNAFIGKDDEFSKAMSMVPLDAHAIALIAATVLPLAVFAASVMIAIAMFARSYKEGQSYLTPLIFLVIFPALMGGMPGLKLTPAMCLIPIFNASQVIRTIMVGEVATVPFATTLVANLVYACIAAYIARKRFEDETVLFRS
jgi:sodium transport system permease protein